MMPLASSPAACSSPAHLPSFCGGASAASSASYKKYYFSANSSKHHRLLALPEPQAAAASVLVAGIVGVSATLLLRRSSSSKEQQQGPAEEDGGEECSDCGGTGLCGRCKGEGFVFKELSEDTATKARKAAKNMATRYTAGLPTKWTYCNKCSSTRSCTTCRGSGRIKTLTSTSP